MREREEEKQERRFQIREEKNELPTRCFLLLLFSSQFATLCPLVSRGLCFFSCSLLALAQVAALLAGSRNREQGQTNETLGRAFFSFFQFP